MIRLKIGPHYMTIRPRPDCSGRYSTQYSTSTAAGSGKFFTVHRDISSVLKDHGFPSRSLFLVDLNQIRIISPYPCSESNELSITSSSTCLPLCWYCMCSALSPVCQEIFHAQFVLVITSKHEQISLREFATLVVGQKSTTHKQNMIRNKRMIPMVIAILYRFRL